VPERLPATQTRRVGRHRAAWRFRSRAAPDKQIGRGYPRAGQLLGTAVSAERQLSSKRDHFSEQLASAGHELSLVNVVERSCRIPLEPARELDDRPWPLLLNRSFGMDSGSREEWAQVRQEREAEGPARAGPSPEALLLCEVDELGSSRTNGLSRPAAATSSRRRSRRSQGSWARNRDAHPVTARSDDERSCDVRKTASRLFTHEMVSR
jgi:hypothetical protein